MLSKLILGELPPYLEIVNIPILEYARDPVLFTPVAQVALVECPHRSRLLSATARVRPQNRCERSTRLVGLP